MSEYSCPQRFSQLHCFYIFKPHLESSVDDDVNDDDNGNDDSDDDDNDDEMEEDSLRK